MMRLLSSFVRRHPLGIGGRMAVAGGIVGVVAALAVVLLLSTIGDLRRSAGLSLETQRFLAAANRLETLTLQLQSGQRGYLLTGDEYFLATYDDAARQLEAATLRFEVLGQGRPDQAAGIHRLARAIGRYYDDWALPLVRLAGHDLPAAQRRLESRKGEEPVVRIRELFSELTRGEEIVGARRESEARAAGRRASLVAASTLAVLLALLGGIVAYFVRVVVVPVRRIDLAAQQRAQGNLAGRVTPVGVGEARRLVVNFNEMADANARTLAELAHEHAELEAVLESSAQAIAMTDRDGGVVFSNRQMDRLWAELGIEVKGGVWPRLAALVERSGGFEQHAAAFAQAAADPEFVYESPFDLPDLARSFVGFTGPVVRTDGYVVGRLFTLRETTAERAAERAKEEFLATVSHELRTPLTSIIGYLEIVRDGDAGALPDEVDRFLGIVDRSARHLNGLVDDLLVVGRNQEGRLDLELGEVDLAEIVAECVESAATSAGEKRIGLTLDADPGLLLEGDRKRLTQLCSNLVGNAIKFTPEGGTVGVTARLVGGVPTLEVADSGIGIAADEQERLFERFFRAATATAAQVPGSGLGLAISKAIVDAHGGTIGVESSPGVGTTFRVELGKERPA